MRAHRPSLDQVFILRFWREEADASDQGRWRVQIRNINTRRRDVVDDVQRAFAIVAGSLGETGGDRDAEGAIWAPTGRLGRQTGPSEDSNE